MEFANQKEVGNEMGHVSLSMTTSANTCVVDEVADAVFTARAELNEMETKRNTLARAADSSSSSLHTQTLFSFLSFLPSRFIFFSNSSVPTGAPLPPIYSAFVHSS